MAWLSGWSYRKEISITGQSGAGTNYQVLLDIGDSAGGDFHLEGNCTNFPQDIAITDNDGETLLDFWIEDITADPLKMWIEVADDLGSNQTIYIYYGKSGASTNSNGTNTFIQYNGQTSDNFKLTNIATAPFIFEARVTQTSAETYDYIGLSNSADPWTDDGVYIGLHPIRLMYTVTYNEGSFTDETIAGDYLTDGIYKIELTGSAVNFYSDGDLASPVHTTNLPDESMGMWYTQGTGDLKWAFIRKYNSPEPAFSSAGSEETPPTGVSPTSVFYGPLVGPLGGPI